MNRPAHSAPAALLAGAFLAALFLSPSGPARAQSPAPAPAPAQGEAAAGAEDKTGTNPLNLQNTFILVNEFQGRGGGRYTNFTNLRYIQAIAGGKAAVRFTLPIVAQNLVGRYSIGDVNVPVDAPDGKDFGFGDLNVRLNFIPKVTPRYGILLGLETSWNTASGSSLGTGKNLIAPVIVYAGFLPGGRIFAPAYQQYFTIGGDDDRSRVSTGAFDFYYVMPAKNGWTIVDPAVTIDYGNDNKVAGQLEIEHGFVIGPHGKGVASWYLRPGVGIGRNRGYDWNLEVGYKIVGL